MTNARQTRFEFKEIFSGKSASTKAAEYMFEKIAEAKRNVMEGEKLRYLDHHSIPLGKGDYEVLLIMEIVPKGPNDEED